MWMMFLEVRETKRLVSPRGHEYCSRQHWAKRGHHKLDLSVVCRSRL